MFSSAQVRPVTVEDAISCHRCCSLASMVLKRKVNILISQHPTRALLVLLPHQESATHHPSSSKILSLTLILISVILRRNPYCRPLHSCLISTPQELDSRLMRQECIQVAPQDSLSMIWIMLSKWLVTTTTETTSLRTPGERLGEMEAMQSYPRIATAGSRQASSSSIAAGRGVLYSAGASSLSCWHSCDCRQSFSFILVEFVIV
mgnify:CR=1 FL=1